MPRDRDQDAARLRGQRRSGEVTRARRASGLSPHPCTSDAGYSDEEAAYLAAVERARTTGGRRFLTAVDYIRVAKGLGYVRPAPTAAP